MPLIHGLEEVTLPDYIIAEAESPSLSHLDSLAYGSNILKTIFLFLRQAILCKRYKVCVPNGVRIIFNIADCHILDHLSTEPVSPDAHRFKTLLLATHVFIYAVKRQMPKGGAIVSILIERLKLSLQASGVYVMAWADHLPALAWVLFIGAATSEGANEENSEWFSSRLQFVVHLMQIRNKAQLLDRLKMFVWTEDCCNNFLNIWWERASLDPDRQLPLIVETIRRQSAEAC